VNRGGFVTIKLLSSCHFPGNGKLYSSIISSNAGGSGDCISLFLLLHVCLILSVHACRVTVKRERVNKWECGERCSGCAVIEHIRFTLFV
jgi:hypothetical protein